LAERPSGHLTPSTPAFKDLPGAVVEVPPPIVDAPYLPAPKPRPKQETYTVVVNQVPVRELLFAMARDAELNIDILSDIEGEVTLNAVDQTLIQILERIALQAPLRYKLDEGYLLITADDPYLQTYPVGYLNMARSSASRVDLATQIQSTGFGAQDGGSSGSNNSQTQVENVSDNAFWNTLVGNIGDILTLGSAASDEASTDKVTVIVNRETGYLTVRATRAQHREIQLYLDQVLASARRQVLIEATVV
jgi:general secretion pathway protein D